MPGVLEEVQAADERWKMDASRTFDEHFERLERIDSRFAREDERMTVVEQRLAENTELTRKIDDKTATLVKWVENVSGFNNVVNWVLAVLVKASVVIVATGILWYFASEGHLPKKVDAPPMVRIEKG